MVSGDPVSAFSSAVSSALARLFEGQRAPAALRTLATYAGRIVSMRSAGTADVATDDLAIGGDGGLGGRSVLVGLPGVRLDLTGGDRVRLGFEAGSPEGAECVGFEQDRSASKGIGRVGDRVKVRLQITTSSIAGVMTITPYVNGAYVPAIPPYVTAPGVPLIIETEGEIISGSEEVLLR